MDWGMITQGVVTAGGILSGIFGALGKKKHKRITEAVIIGIEKAPDNDGVKRMVKIEAASRGINGKLHKEVKRLTPTVFKGY